MPTVAELKDRCKQKGLKGYSKLKKAELEQLLASVKSPKVKTPPTVKPPTVKPPTVKPCKKPCPADKICNTKTGICVNKDGKIGKEILKGVKPTVVKPTVVKVTPPVTRRDMLELYRTTQGRYSLAKEVRSMLKTKGIENCIVNDAIDNIKIFKKLGEGSFGNVFLAGCVQSIPNYCDIQIAIKQGRITKKTVKNVEKHEGWREINILNKIVNPIVESGKCPNLPIIYKEYFCGSCDFTFKGQKKVLPCAIQLMELATFGGLDKYINEKLDDIDIYCMIFQCFAGLHALQMNGVFQNDIKLMNILVHNVKPGGYWKYTILGEDYYIPNRGKVFLINDFGVSYCTIPKFEIGDNPFAKSVQIRNGKLYPLAVKGADGLTRIIFEGKTYDVAKRPFSKPVEFMPLPSTKYEILTDKLLNDSLTFPSNSFVIDTSDLIYSFVGGLERVNQPGKHTQTSIPEKIKSELIKYALWGDQKGTGFVKQVNNIIPKIEIMKPYHILAGYFINAFFKNMFRTGGGNVLEEYKL